MILIVVLYKFYFVFIHGFLVKQVFIISLIVVVIFNIKLVRELDLLNQILYSPEGNTVSK